MTLRMLLRSLVFLSLLLLLFLLFPLLLRFERVELLSTQQHKNNKNKHRIRLRSVINVEFNQFRFDLFRLSNSESRVVTSISPIELYQLAAFNEFELWDYSKLWFIWLSLIVFGISQVFTISILHWFWNILDSSWNRYGIYCQRGYGSKPCFGKIDFVSKYCFFL